MQILLSDFTPIRGRRALIVAIMLLSMPAGTLRAGEPDALANEGKSQLIRCAVIGGLVDTGLWPAVAERFEKQTGHRAALVSAGPKHVIAGEFARGGVDLITMHSSDAIMNLVADGQAENPQPWVRNDMILVGPPSDPAGVRGGKDAIAAIKKIIDTKSTLLVHASSGANEVLSDLLAGGGLQLDPKKTLSLPADKHRQMLRKAAQEKAYTIVGRIPFLAGKIDSGDLVVMVQGDPRLRRPYVVATTTDQKDPARRQASQQLAAFLRSPETQEWVAEYGRDRLDDQPLFFPVSLPESPAKTE